MEIKSRAFPYPVLGPGLDDFTEGAVNLTAANVESAPERYTLKFQFEVTHPSLAKFISEKQAAAAVVIECRQNLYRRRHPVLINREIEITIPADELRGDVQVTPVVSAARDLPDYRPASLNPDYAGIRISVPKHGLLAFGANLEFFADPQADRLRRISSIMRVTSVADAGRGMRINIDGPRIRVEVSPDVYKLYRAVAESGEGSQILASMLVLPVLLEVCHRIKNSTDNFEDFRWFQILRTRLREVNHPCDDDNFDPLIASQTLLDHPLARSIDELFKHTCQD